MWRRGGGVIILDDELFQVSRSRARRSLRPELESCQRGLARFVIPG